MLEEKEVWEAYNHIEVCAGLIINLKCCISTFVCNDDVMACVVIEVKHLSSDKYTNTTEDAKTKITHTNTDTPIQTYYYEHTNTIQQIQITQVSLHQNCHPTNTEIQTHKFK